MKESEYWRDSDLTYAIVIMSWFHALAGFCHGVGINPELDAREGHTVRIRDGIPAMIAELSPRSRFFT